MNPVERLCIALGASAMLGGSASGQLNVPTIIQLPTENFQWTWGEPRSIDDPDRPEFTVTGGEQAFRCTAKGAFKAGSHIRDYYNLRDFKQALNTSVYFIQDATATLNSVYLSNDLQWAVLDCAVPEGIESEDAVSDRIDRAMEKAEQDRARRREREARATQ
jgi:hypothetical protein